MHAQGTEPRDPGPSQSEEQHAEGRAGNSESGPQANGLQGKSHRGITGQSDRPVRPERSDVPRTGAARAWSLRKDSLSGKICELDTETPVSTSQIFHLDDFSDASA